MGNCCGGARKQGIELNNIKKQRHHREQAWTRTGVIGVRDAKLKDLPSSVYSVGTAARVLDGSNNQLTTVAPQIAELSALQRLILSNNAIQHLPLEAFRLTSLKWLILDSNSLSGLPDELEQVTSLERLSVCNNSLSHLPDGIGKLQRLSICRASGNKLSNLPTSLGRCSALEELDLSDNYLQAIPDSLGDLQQLKILSLDQNRIDHIPTSVLRGCKKLHTLQLQNNPVTMQELEATEGYRDFEGRRQGKYSKQIATGVMSSTMKESIDRQAA